MAEWIDNLVEDLKVDEGLRTKAYVDTVGVWTIGYGHTGGVKQGDRITEAKAETLLREDLEEAIDDARAVCSSFDGLSGPRKAVVANMAFNMGRNRLSTFVNTLRYIDDDEYGAAARNMMQSKWAKQVGKRAVRLAKQMLTGDYQPRG